MHRFIGGLCVKLLIVEDEDALRKALVKGFEKSGYAVDAAEDGHTAIDRFFDAHYDAIVLDLNLPGKDGIDVLREIRKEDERINVLILSARGEVEDKISGLDLGANDYLAKPFSFKELHARVRALTRRDYSDKGNVIESGPVVLDMALKQVRYKERRVSLTKKEYGILEYLMLNRGKIVRGEDLIEHVWSSDVDSFTNAFKVHVTSLRKKLPKDFIQTVRGEGYYVE